MHQQQTAFGNIEGKGKIARNDENLMVKGRVVFWA